MGNSICVHLSFKNRIDINLYIHWAHGSLKTSQGLFSSSSHRKFPDFSFDFRKSHTFDINVDISEVDKSFSSNINDISE